MTDTVRPKVMIAINTAWNIYNFRAGLIRALTTAGYDVVALAPPDAFIDRLEAMGCRFVPLPMRGHGTSVMGEMALLWRFWRVLRAERPAAYLGFTVKPNTYGSLLASLMGIRVINNISGLGTAFLRGGLLARLVQGLYKIGLYGSGRVFFQNQADRDLFVARGLVRGLQAGLLPGSGIDLQSFSAASVHSVSPGVETSIETPPGELRFLLLARLIREKGVVEFVDAARSLKARFPQARFQLLGFLDADNPRAITPLMLQSWVDEGAVDYLGSTDDVRPFLADADCVVLPSYREGTSRALLEAAAMGRPLIVSDVPGCREVVDAGVSGLLCQARDTASLAEKMQEFLQLPPDLRMAMGLAGRRKMEREYDEKIVTEAYLNELARLGVGPAPKLRA